MEDVIIGRAAGDLIPDTAYTRLVGNTAFPWGSIYHAGEILTGITGAAGVTYHGFDTTGGWTQGNLFGFALNNATKVYGDTHGGIFQSWTLPEVFNVKSARFGAKGNGTTDDTTAIQNAITAATGAADGAGGIVFFPPGIYIVNSALTITSRVRLVGSGDRISTIRAGGSFTFNGTTDAIVKISGGSDNYGTVEDLQIDCNNVASSICVYMNDCHERSGPRNCTLVRFRLYGTDIDTNSQNVTIDDVDFLFSASSTTAVGIRFSTVGSRNRVSNCTFTSYDGVANSSGSAISVVASSVDLYSIHIEFMGNGSGNAGIRYDDNSTGVCIGIYGHSTVTTLIEIGPGVMIFNAIHNSGTNLIGDRVAGLTVTSAAGANSGFYMRSNDGGAGTKDLWSSVPYIRNYHGAPTVFGTTFTVIGTAIGSSVAVLTCGTELTLPAGNLFGISSAPAGATTVTNIVTTGNEGRRVTFIGSAGTVTFANGEGLKTGGPAVAAGETVEFICWGTTWTQIATKGP
jgi:hypothetical protein